MDNPLDILIVRGHLATPWELRPWTRLGDEFRVSYLQTSSNKFETGALDLEPAPARTLRDRLPAGTVFDHLTGLVGERYLGADEQFDRADIVHAEELSFWFAAEAAKRRPGRSFKLVQTVWETIPFMDTYRMPKARKARRQVLEQTDLFLPATERAREALLLEGVAPERIRVCSPGIDLERFATARRPEHTPEEHVIVSPGRLVWEKGHQDVVRAVAALHHGLVPLPDGCLPPRLLVIGRGPEEGRLRSHAAELGLGDAFELRAMVPYDEMPGVFAACSCLALASLPNADHSLYLGDPPRAFWEEQFGLVFVEAMAAGLPIVASNSGAIPEVVGDSGQFFTPGTWMDIARLLAEGPLTRPPGTRIEHPAHRLRTFSAEAMAERLAGAYRDVLER
ncbi:MAG: glycosyltransferase family 4 protein [Solirubrobacterales bacterium]